jgi:hypothetical protein
VRLVRKFPNLGLKHRTATLRPKSLDASGNTLGPRSSSAESAVVCSYSAEAAAKAGLAKVDSWFNVPGVKWTLRCWKS